MISPMVDRCKTQEFGPSAPEWDVDLSDGLGGFETVSQSSSTEGYLTSCECNVRWLYSQMNAINDYGADRIYIWQRVMQMSGLQY